MMTHDRIKWIDAARAIGIFAIYVGHIPNAEWETSLPFVWLFHVPLFFFLAGCADACSKKTTFGKYLLKKASDLVIPWFIFSFLSLAVHVLIKQCAVSEFEYYLDIIKSGTIRNQYMAGALWFLTCLFVVQVLFYWIKKLEHPLLIIGVSLVCYICSNAFFQSIRPGIPFNIDSALYYIIFYACGFVLLPVINLLLDSKERWSHILLAVSGLLSLWYADECFFRGELLRLTTNYTNNEYIIQIEWIALVLILIWSVLCMARFVQEISIVQDIGKKTLYLCGGEYFATKVVSAVLGALGLQISVKNAFEGIIYAVILLCISRLYVVPILQWVCEEIKMIPNKVIRNE